MQLISKKLDKKTILLLLCNYMFIKLI
jgi:hypothetical protein